MELKIGEKISKYRKLKGYTQEQLGELVGVSGQAVSKWENGGVPDTYLLPTISKVLGVSIDALFGVEKKISDYSQDEILDDLFKFCLQKTNCNRTKPYFEYIKQTLMYEVPNQIERFHSPSSYSTWEWYCMAVIDNFLSERPTAIIEELGVFLSVFEEQIPDFMCYPNPFSDEIHVCIDSERLVADEISIYDMLGRKVFAMPCQFDNANPTITFNPPLNAGVYVLRIGELTQKIVRY